MGITKNKELIESAIKSLKDLTPEENIKITHVCGTHEMTASRFGIRSIIPENIDLIPGPGCPVCVCPSYEIDYAIQLAEQGKIITTFGDMFKVPASRQSLSEVKRSGADVRVVYSPLDSIEIAKKNPDKDVIFFAIGFETSAPMTGAALLSSPPENFFVLSAHRLTVPAMELLLKSENKKTQGFICPGHVSVMIGTDAYTPFSKKYNMPCVITGFEAIDMLIGLVQIMKMIQNKESDIINEYQRVVKPEGNTKALQILEEAFEIVDSFWRGIGIVEKSGLTISSQLKNHDAKKVFDIVIDETIDVKPGCKCPEVMLGNMLPSECKLFQKKCRPDNPVGPCMVSHEGTCAIFARYGSTDMLKNLK